MDYKKYNEYLQFNSVRRMKLKKQAKEDYEVLDKNGKVCLILIFIFSMFIINWGNNITKAFGLN